ncbi:caprolactamase subunit beta [Stappia indica]|uniref:caprolactamase subunit beta n=1 Tax=Stappia indica TaxID=538381 RepID=UPI001CD80187|nr:hydantoinase B/oxoprolinase family protein [Stappia indica]MCA1300695.1 hydantoinase B/oxoprolinase family protein [Stappia indica]
MEQTVGKPERSQQAQIDPITLSVVRGILETTQREMTLSLEKTARSSVFNLAHDYSTALFNATPEMILQGQDIPIHLGSLIPAMKVIADYFGDDIHEGDLILHNDPAYGGSHAIDTCMYKPVFYEGKLVYWTVCKGHLTDIGGPVPAGYNPEAKEIYAECLRIPPVKIWDRGKPRHDVLNMILTNMRARRDQEGDFNALIGACQVGERNLIRMLEKYGTAQVDACVDELLAMAERQMRSLIRTVPAGTYEGTAVLEDAGHGFGDFDITAKVTIEDDSCHIEISSPPQIPYFINSYEGNSYSGVYLGLMMFAQLPPPYNEGLYRCVSVNMGPKGTLCNAQEPAPHMNCTTTPMETLTDAVRLAFEKAMPSKVAASWGHANGLNIAGWDTRHDEEYVTMVLATIISGAGATPQQDGWHACGPECCFGALTSGDVELLEHSYPIIIHRYSLMTDSGGAGLYRGGSGTAWEVEPLDSDMTFIMFGEGRWLPALGAAGAGSQMTDTKVGRLELKRDGKVETIRDNTIGVIKPGETVTNMNPGGGGYGDPMQRPVDKVLADVKLGLVSLEGARRDYGVVIEDAGSLRVDLDATRKLRAA